MADDDGGDGVDGEDFICLILRVVWSHSGDKEFNYDLLADG